MNEWIKKMIARVKELLGKWTLIQKIIFFGIIGAAVLGVILLITFSSAPSMVPLLNRSITDQQELNLILARLDEEGVEYRVTADQRIMVEDEQTAQRLRTVLTSEDLIPGGTDPWELFDIERWTQTDFERNVNLRRAITSQLVQHIEALNDIDDASVNLVLPERELFAEDQNPVTASIIITPAPGSDISENRKKIEGIEKLVQFAVEGLEADNITITDHRGIVLNDFEGMAEFDRLELTRREQKIIEEIENQYKKNIYRALAGIFTKNRVEIVNIDVSMDMSKKTVDTEEHFPITMTEDNPRTPFDETENVPSITISREEFSEYWEGLGFNPQGPPGQEGQTPPAYKDLEDIVGKYNREQTIDNEVVNTRNISEEKSPVIGRVTVAVALDGKWKWSYNENGEVIVNPDGSIERQYIPVGDDNLAKAKDLIEHAVGYDADRGDSVSVQHIPFDHTEEFAKEDADYARRRQIQMTVLYVLIGVAALLIAFIAFRLISRELERRRRLREEELARQHQAMREAALRSAEEETTEVEMSVEERARLEMMENAINMAREHPEDVAQLIRTWMMEE